MEKWGCNVKYSMFNGLKHVKLSCPQVDAAYGAQLMTKPKLPRERPSKDE